LIRAGAIGGVIGAAATMLVAAVARAADVPLEIDGKVIPLAGFATMTLLGAILGVGLAAALKERGRFVAVCAVLTAASMIPSIAEPDDTATKVVLVATHLVAAAVIIPMLVRELRARIR
jgi:hypothetical protein